MVRDASNADEAAIREVVYTVLAEYGLAPDPDGTDADLADLEGNYWRRGGVFRVVVSAEGPIVGCAGLFRLNSMEAEVRKMYLLPLARGSGLGRLLLDQLIADARRLGYRRVVLETASVLSEAIGLYRSAGFSPVPRENLSSRCDQAWSLSLSPDDEVSVSLPSQHRERMRRARLSLEGLSLGDAFGERFFLPPVLAESLVERRALPDPPWRYTDDTVMALSIVETLEIHGAIDRDALARRFADKYRADPERGYGLMAHRILGAIGGGSPWRRVSSAAFGGMGSMGNGGAMRAAPIGGYFWDDLEAASREAQRSAEVTHAHPEGQAGAAAVAVAAARACGGPSDAREILEAAVDFTPDGETRAGIARALRLPCDSPVGVAVSALGNGSRVISQDTVPFALWCAARNLTRFEEALWTTVSGLGDRDTTCAIAGGIVSLAVGREALPSAWLASRESLATLAGDVS